MLFMLLAKRFGMEYVDSDGQTKNPYIIHRTSLGCYERTLAYLLEKYAGALPMWMAPTQAVVIPLNPDFNGYAQSIVDRMEDEDMRVELDARNETLGKRIREAQLKKIPYMIVVGAKEAEEGTAALRSRKGEDLGAMSVDDLIAKFRKEIREKAR